MSKRNIAGTISKSSAGVRVAKLMFTSDITEPKQFYINARIIFDAKADLQSEAMQAWKGKVLQILRENKEIIHRAKQDPTLLVNVVEQLRQADAPPVVQITDDADVPTVQFSIVEHQAQRHGVWIGGRPSGKAGEPFQWSSRPYDTPADQRPARNGLYRISQPENGNHAFRGSNTAIAL